LDHVPKKVKDLAFVEGIKETRCFHP
jgi:hypothetical protein